MRAFVAVADTGQFSAAADDLDVTQQAVSKRIAALESELGTRLFARTPRGAGLTSAGRAMLPHAREILSSAERIVASVQRPPLRVDVITRRIAPAALLRDFHRAYPSMELEVTTLFDADTAIAAVASGEIDATFRAIIGELPRGVEAVRVLDEPHELLVGPGHRLAHAEVVTPAQLAEYPIWIPGIVPGTEWAAYYEELAAAFGLAISAQGPNFGTDTMLDALAEDSSLASLLGERTRLVWPAEYGLRRIPVRDPVLAYPHSLLWRDGNPHPGLASLRDFLRPVTPIRPASAAPAPGTSASWLPSWAT
ncbi:MAG: LysR family transcriptional regulator [Nocardiopsaceae bacterium]|nr:LysR family transcriptional regulator [Nocardiopsaceae bacterium]